MKEVKPFSDGATLITFADKRYTKKDLTLIQSNTDFTVYEVASKELYLYLPHSQTNSSVIAKCQNRLSQFRNLGLQTIDITTAEATITQGNTDNNSPRITIGISSSLDAFATNNNTILYRTLDIPNEDYRPCIAKNRSRDITDYCLKANNQETQEMLKELLGDYATALSFKLPLYSLGNFSASTREMIAFHLPPTNILRPPVVRLFFNQHLSTYAPEVLPCVPSLKELAEFKGAATLLASGKYSFLPLDMLANQVAVALSEIPDAINLEKKIQDAKAIETKIQSAFGDNKLLTEGMRIARTNVSRFYLEKLASTDSLDGRELVETIKGIISTDNKPLFDLALSKFKTNFAKLSTEQAKELVQFTKKYEACSELTPHVLKEIFLIRYNKSLELDKSAWLGLYSFFVRSNVRADMSYAELVQQAQSNDERSRAVMQELSLLDPESSAMSL